MKKHTTPITQAEELLQLVDQLKAHKRIAFDTEFIRESTFFPTLELIQVATRDESWIVDVQAFKVSGKKRTPEYDEEALRPLLSIFQDPSIEKVAHAVQADQECLYSAFGIVASPIFDTAAAASLCGYGDTIGLAPLMKSVLDVRLKKGHARTNWSKRPIVEDLIEYALSDVTDLISLADRLTEKLEKLNRVQWAQEISEIYSRISMYEDKTDEMAYKLLRSGRVDSKGHGVLYELVHWREKEIRRLNIPRRWLADDSVLMDLASVRPKEAEKLKRFRGLKRIDFKKHAPEILDAIQRGMTEKNFEIPEIKKQKPPSGEESAVIDLLKCFLNHMGEKHALTPRHLVKASDSIHLIRNPELTVEDWVSKGWMSQGAADLVGRDLLNLLHGHSALVVDLEQRKISLIDRTRDDA
ncbi:MAG: hypothetical protein CL678_16260 [Bdellovibrionaceae bacterium]|nr:hypothetical protein [Pseudobdellovibrionaceae bacterium]|tara:strand:- start:59 stop:1294 length:1236 start_codon:yes stop_codon:yes gene_type:complete